MSRRPADSDQRAVSVGRQNPENFRIRPEIHPGAALRRRPTKLASEGPVTLGISSALARSLRNALPSLATNALKAIDGSNLPLSADQSSQTAAVIKAAKYMVRNDRRNWHQRPMTLEFRALRRVVHAYRPLPVCNRSSGRCRSASVGSAPRAASASPGSFERSMPSVRLVGSNTRRRSAVALVGEMPLTFL
jgi:hypothetical protein